VVKIDPSPTGLPALYLLSSSSSRERRIVDQAAVDGVAVD
jgi:hypothetical protein